MLTFDHVRLVARHRGEWARILDHFRNLRPGAVDEVCILHEQNGSCCDREPWPVTRTAVLESLLPADRN
jgi:hypothetical protein